MKRFGRAIGRSALVFGFLLSMGAQAQLHPVESVDPFVGSVDLAWQNRDLINAAFANEMIAINFEINSGYLRKSIATRFLFTKAKSPSEQQRVRDAYKEPESIGNAIKSYLDKYYEAQTIFQKMRETTNPFEFHNNFLRVIEISRSHISYNFETYVHYELLKRVPATKLDGEFCGQYLAPTGT